VIEERFIREVGITEWKFANGARVLLKPTDFTPDQVLVTGYGWGGTSVDPATEPNDVPSVPRKSIPWYP